MAEAKKKVVINDSKRVLTIGNVVFIPGEKVSVDEKVFKQVIENPNFKEMKITLKKDKDK